MTLAGASQAFLAGGDVFDLVALTGHVFADVLGDIEVIFDQQQSHDRSVSDQGGAAHVGARTTSCGLGLKNKS